MAQPVATFTVAQHGSFLLDQDTPDDSMSVWQTDDLGGINAIHAKLTVRRVGVTDKMNPTFGFELKRGDDAARFQVFTKPGKTVMIPLLTEDTNHSETSDSLLGGVFASSFQVGETVDVEISWTDQGVVTVALEDKASRSINGGAERHTVTLAGGPPSSILVVAANGEAEFKPLQLGRSAP